MTKPNLIVKNVLDSTPDLIRSAQNTHTEIQKVSGGDVEVATKVDITNKAQPGETISVLNKQFQWFSYCVFMT